jgi:hypothetical protein
LRVINNLFVCCFSAVCPTGALCTSNGIYAEAGYYVYFDETDTLQSDPCLPGYCIPCDGVAPLVSLSNTTVNGTTTTVTTTTAVTNSALGNVTVGLVFSCCSANRVDPKNNPFCGACKPDYFLWAEECACK